MPHVLVACRLVVLAERCTFAFIRCPYTGGYGLREVPDIMADIRGELINVLDVCTGDDKHRTGIVRPPLRRDTGIGLLGDRNHVRWAVPLVEVPPLQLTERTDISFGLMQ
jgi:hypothetical protein